MTKTDSNKQEVIFNEQSIQQDVINRSAEIKKLVADDFKPFSGKVGSFFEKLGNTIQNKCPLFAASVAIVTSTVAFNVYQNIQEINNGVSGMGAMSFDQTMGLVTGSAALMVAHFALPPIAKAISKIATHFELKKYFAENDSVVSKFSDAMSKLGDGRGQDHLKQIASEGRAKILDSLKTSQLSENPSVRDKIRDIFEEKVHNVYHSSLSNLNKKNNDTLLSR